jgi:hypothetical protein
MRLRTGGIPWTGHGGSEEICDKTQILRVDTTIRKKKDEKQK